MPSTGTGEGRKPYDVLRIDEMTRMADGGGIERYYRHRIKTRSGQVRTVDIREHDFTPEKVKEILTEKAADVDKIMQG